MQKHKNARTNVTLLMYPAPGSLNIARLQCQEDFHGFLKDVTKEPERPLERSLEDNIKALSAGEIQVTGFS